MNRHSLARRLAAVEQQRDRRRLAHTYHLADGTTVRLSTFDMLRTFMAGLSLNGQQPTEPPPVARTMAQLPADADTSVMGRSMRAVAAEWCAAFDEHRPMTLHRDEDGSTAP